MAGAVGQGRVKDKADLGLLLEPARDLERTFLMLLQAHRHGPQSTGTEPGIVGRQGVAEIPAGTLNAVMKLLRGCGSADHDVRMTAHIFGRGDDRDVDPGRNRGKEK